MIGTGEAIQVGMLLDELLTDSDCDGVLIKQKSERCFVVTVSAAWTDWEDHHYDGASIYVALHSAVQAKRLG